nr:hypothetical protein KPHV_48370 [Kitasatospora purpeofusca]
MKTAPECGGSALLPASAKGGPRARVERGGTQSERCQALRMLYPKPLPPQLLVLKVLVMTQPVGIVEKGQAVV